MNIIVKPLISEKMTRISEAAASPVLSRIQRDKGKPEPVAHKGNQPMCRIIEAIWK